MDRLTNYTTEHPVAIIIVIVTIIVIHHIQLQDEATRESEASLTRHCKAKTLFEAKAQ